jgi:hypothetical protein
MYSSIKFTSSSLDQEKISHIIGNDQIQGMILFD